MKSHPIPSDKGSLGNFELLSQDNKHVIQQILEDGTPPSIPPTYDDLILKKLRTMYSSCMDEKTLAKRDIKPLMRVVTDVQQLYRGNMKSRSETEEPDYEVKDRQSLTAVLAYLHARSIGSLFTFNIDGDVGTDPNLMSLWFG